MPIRKDLLEYRVNLKKQLKGIKDKDQRKRAAKIAGEEALKKLKEYMDRQKSPVTGNRFKALKKKTKDGKPTAYPDYKQEVAGNKKANLKLTGDMINEIELDYDKDSFTIFIDDPDETAKAYNHNVGDTVAKRNFIPNDARKEKFHRSIRDKYEKKIKDYAKKLPKKKAQDAEKESIKNINIDDFLDAISTRKITSKITTNEAGLDTVIKTLDIDDFI